MGVLTLHDFDVEFFKAENKTPGDFPSPGVVSLASLPA
jgi:hypothetical protein